jgi:hypothetical protein
MKNKEATLFNDPTQDEVRETLEKIEEATIDEELERKRRGLTQEPAAKRKKRPEGEKEKERAWSVRDLSNITDQNFHDETDELVSDNVGEYVSKWREKQMPKVPGPLKFIDHIPLESKGDLLPIYRLVDETVGRVIEIDEKNLDNKLGVKKFIKKYAKQIEVLGNSSLYKDFWQKKIFW